MVVWTLLAGLASPAGPAWAQVDSREGIALQNQLLELRRDLQALRDQVSRGGGQQGGGSFLGIGRPSPPAANGASEMTPELLGRVQTLEEEVRRLRGSNEELGNQIQRQTQDLAKQIGDLDFRLQAVEGKAGLRPAGSAAMAPPVPGVSSAGVAAMPPLTALPDAAPLPPQAGGHRTPELALQEGNAALARRDYQAAELAANEVLSAGRATPRAYDAQFLRAQALAGRKDWAQAAIAFDDTYSHSRTGSHAPDALLGLAAALTAISEKRSACETLDKFRAEFPSPRPDLREQASALRQRAGCR